MKRLFIISSMVLLASLALFLGACGGEDGDTLTGLPDITPLKYDWQIIIMDGDSSMGKSTYGINCYWLGQPSAITDDDVFSIKFDGESYTLENFNLGIMRAIYGSANLNPGTLYNISFYKNNQLVGGGSIRTPYRAQGSFPTNYRPQESAALSWTLSEDNQYQSVTLSSESEGMEEDDDFAKDLEPSLRSFTFPVNAVQDFGPNTSYTMSVLQYSFLKSGRTAFLAAHTNAQHYGEEHPAKKNSNLQLKKLADRLCARH